MSKKKQHNKFIRNKFGSITLKEMIDKVEVDPFYHIKDGSYIGGLTIPQRND